MGCWVVVGVYGKTTVQLVGLITLYLTTALTLYGEENIALLGMNSLFKSSEIRLSVIYSRHLMLF
jgi:hypothetical protein